ncbi:hypothetical protein D4R52_01350 [bacterium]|nr:MAG: hypothetical protein D4R52_01350 [bacterium]
MAIAVSLVLVEVLKILSFDDHWWDVTVPLLFLTSMAALILGIIAIRKKQESSVFVHVSVILGLLTILFVLSHSLFISD